MSRPAMLRMIKLNAATMLGFESSGAGMARMPLCCSATIAA